MADIVLIVKKSPVLEVGKALPLKEGENILGRVAEGTQVLVPDKLVSRKHCLIIVNDDNRVFVSDLKSGNGTLVNDRRVADKKEMSTGDKLQVGDTQMELEVPIELLSTNVMLAQKRDAPSPPTPSAPPSRADQRHTPIKNAESMQKRSLAIPKLPKALLIKAGAAFGILLLLLGGVKMLLQGGGPAFPKPADCTQVHAWNQGGYKFRHPPGWQRFDKISKNEFTFTYFDRSILYFGASYAGKTGAAQTVGFIVDTLNGLPPQMALEEVAETDGKKFPREMDHGLALTHVEQAELNRKKALLGESPVFSYNDQDIQTLEACIIERGRRYLLLAYAPRELFPKLVPVFREMIGSFEVGTLAEEFAKPEDVRKDSALLVKLADPLVQKSDVKPENLFLALQKYRQAAFLLNRFDFKKEDPERRDLLEKFKNTQTLLDDRYRDLKFKIERGLKIKNDAVVFEAAKEILDMIPDNEDERRKSALMYYNNLKNKFEKTGMR